jgi:carbamoyl-phosphate synthase large subunit
VLGTSPLAIDQCEDRYKFSQLLDKYGVQQPAWKELSTLQKAEEFANEVGYPVLVRPSFVLSGAGMKVAYNQKQLHDFLGAAVDVSPDHPVVMTQFLLGARELELDAVANKGQIVNWAVSEHVEDAGVHSGDATMICPSDTVPPSVQARLREIGSIIASALKISGPMNVQYLWKGDQILVIECNLRASRSFPFVSKVYDINFIETATKIFLNQDVKYNEVLNSIDINRFDLLLLKLEVIILVIYFFYLLSYSS